jgi:hypothetical protein
MAGVASKRQQEEFSRQWEKPVDSDGLFPFVLPVCFILFFSTQYSKLNIQNCHRLCPLPVALTPIPMALRAIDRTD